MFRLATREGTSAYWVYLVGNRLSAIGDFGPVHDHMRAVEDSLAYVIAPTPSAAIGVLRDNGMCDIYGFMRGARP